MDRGSLDLGIGARYLGMDARIRPPRYLRASVIWQQGALTLDLFSICSSISWILESADGPLRLITKVSFFRSLILCNSLICSFVSWILDFFLTWNLSRGIMRYLRRKCHGEKGLRRDESTSSTCWFRRHSAPRTRSQTKARFVLPPNFTLLQC
jgi:hypothetical protein